MSNRRDDRSNSPALFEQLEGRMLLSSVPVVSIDAATAAASENGDVGQFVITRDVVTASALRVNLAITGTAGNGSDYAKLPAYAIIPANAASVTVRVLPVDDGKAESPETVILAVKPAATYTADALAASDTVTIADGTYLAADFFPLVDGARWDYNHIAGKAKTRSYTTVEQNGGLFAWSPYVLDDSDWSASDVANLQTTPDGIKAVSYTDGDGTTPYTPAQLWLPTVLQFGQSTSGVSNYSKTGETSTSTWTVKVVGMKTVTVPAGKFRCVEVQMTIDEADTLDGETAPYQTSHTVYTLDLARGVGVVNLKNRWSAVDSGGKYAKFYNEYLTSYCVDSDWAPETALNTARDEFASGVINGKIYAFGGNNDHPINSTEAFDPGTGDWTTLASSPGDGAQQLTGAVVNGKFYVFGGYSYSVPGYNRSTINFVKEYNPATDTWTTKAAKPTTVSSAPCAVYNGEIYVFGGWFQTQDTRGRDHVKLCDVVEAYNPATDTWRVVTKMPKKLGLPGVAVVGDSAYVIGGYTGNYKASSATLAFNFLTQTWTTKGLAAMPQARVSSYSSALPTRDGKIYVVGGALGGAGQFWASNRVDIYDPVANTWTAGPTLPQPISDHAAVIVSDTLYAIGGYNSIDNVWSVSLR